MFGPLLPPFLMMGFGLPRWWVIVLCGLLWGGTLLINADSSWSNVVGGFSLAAANGLVGAGVRRGPGRISEVARRIRRHGR